MNILFILLTTLIMIFIPHVICMSLHINGKPMNPAIAYPIGVLIGMTVMVLHFAYGSST